MNQLKEVYTELYGDFDAADPRQRNRNLEQLAARLSEIAHRESPWSRRHLLSVIKAIDGDPAYKLFRLTPDLADALTRLAAVAIDGDHPLAVLVKKIQAYSLNGNVTPGSILTGKTKACAGCGVLIVPHHPRQKYCHPGCKSRSR